MVSYSRSRKLSRAEITKHGCFTTLDVRVSLSEEAINQACFEVHEDWRKQGNVVFDDQCCYDPIHNVLALSMPECLPDRIAPLAAMMEVVFIQDDILDDLDSKEADILSADWADGSAAYDRTQEMAERHRMKKQLESRIMMDVIATDREGGLRVLQCWKTFYKNANGTRAPTSFKTLEEFLDYRYTDAGSEVTHEICCWAQGVTLSDSEKAAVQHIVHPILMEMCIVNDYYSFDKEFAAYNRNQGTGGIPNAVWVIMNKEGVTAIQAKEKLRAAILDFEELYKARREELRVSGKDIPDRVWRYIDAAEWAAIGSFYWSTFCGRYNRYLGSSGQDGQQWIQAAPEEPVKAGKIVRHDSLGCENNSAGSLKPDPQGEPEFRVVIDGEEQGTEASFGTPFSTLTTRMFGDEIIMAPGQYISALPSKGIRGKVIDALNVWYALPDAKLTPIKKTIDLLHEYSLMIDDIQDQSALRRGRPSTHHVFGVAQTINSGNYIYTLALEEVQKLSSPEALPTYTSEVKILHRGQALDLHWTYTGTCPTEREYVSMVDQKTGGLFRLLGKLMQAESDLSTDLQIESLLTLVGRYFQIRDDYQNLVSAEYTATKGMCEDLDEGKYSLALIHLLNNTSKRLMIEALLQERKRTGSMTVEMKQLILDDMKACGSLEYVAEVCKDLESAIFRFVDRVEEISGAKNWILRLALEVLRL